jgi:hypothetical protein
LDRSDANPGTVRTMIHAQFSAFHGFYRLPERTNADHSGF